MIVKAHTTEFGLELDVDGLHVWKDWVPFTILERMSLIQMHPFWEYSPIDLLRLKDILPTPTFNGVQLHRLFSYGDYYDREIV